MRILNSSFIVLFLTIIMLPLIFIDLSSDRISVQENRMLAERPKLSDMTRPIKFIREFDAWFKDSIGFRELFIRLYNKTNMMYSQDYYLDGQSIVFIGQQGHHFHTHYNQLLPIYRGKRWLDDTTLHELSIKLNQIKQYLNQKNIQFVVMICVDKESIYPEYYPKFIIRGPEPTSLDVVTEYLYKHTEVDLFCIKERLLQEKENYLVFPKTGNIYELCHFNETGSFFAYQELMNHIKIYFPYLKSYSIEDINIIYRYNGSSSVSLKKEATYSRIDSRFFNDAIEFKNNNTNLPILLLLRDSYADWFHNYLPQHFSRTIFHHWETIEHLEEYIDLYDPNIVVFELAERNIPLFASAVINYKR